jgi:3D (Asp-Asp-Asp) domain-containing protein
MIMTMMMINNNNNKTTTTTAAAKPVIPSGTKVRVFFNFWVLAPC